MFQLQFIRSLDIIFPHELRKAKEGNVLYPNQGLQLNYYNGKEITITGSLTSGQTLLR